MKSQRKLARVEAAVAIASVRSPAAVWLRKNREEFADLLARRGPRWKTIAAVLASEGLLKDANGEPIKPETLRSAWRREMMKQPGARPKPAPSPPMITTPSERTPIPDARPSPAGGTGSGFRAPAQHIAEGQREELLGNLGTKRK